MPRYYTGCVRHQSPTPSTTRASNALLAIGTSRMIARVLRCSASAVEKWRSGVRQPDEAFQAKLFAHFGIDPSWWSVPEKRVVGRPGPRPQLPPGVTICRTADGAAWIVRLPTEDGAMLEYKRPGTRQAAEESALRASAVQHRRPELPPEHASAVGVRTPRPGRQEFGLDRRGHAR